jgi:hypothetical protein
MLTPPLPHSLSSGCLPLPGTETNAIGSLDERRFEGRLARRMRKNWLSVVEGVVVEG